VEDQQPSTVKGEEELNPEFNDEATEVQDTELEASAEAIQADPDLEEESTTSDDVVDSDIEPDADDEPEAEMESPQIGSSVAEEAALELDAELEEPVAEAEESELVAEEEAVSEESIEPDETVEELAIAPPEDEALSELPPVEAPVNGNDGQFAVMAEELAVEAEPEVPVQRVAEPDDGREWYVVHCYSGYENKVRHNLEQRIETMDMKGKIFDVVVPTEEEMEVKEGKRRTVERRVFPGYILVQMIMDEDSWYVVRNTPGVTGFVGMGNEPTPLRPEEVSQIVKRMEADAPRIKVTYDVGQKVRIIDGPFNDFIGTVDDIDMDKAKVRVMVSFFGRETPVELDFLQVEKA
jgi:transcriptional antiterminator NusG